jgi:hypothetical protein
MSESLDRRRAGWAVYTASGSFGDGVDAQQKERKNLLLNANSFLWQDLSYDHAPVE